MYREMNIVSNRLSEKALFFFLTYRLSFFVSYCLITKQSVATKGLRHYPIVLFKRLINLPRLIGICVAFLKQNSIRGTKGGNMGNQYNIQAVREQPTELMIIVKATKYLCCYTMTFCLVYIALWFYHYEQMVL